MAFLHSVMCHVGLPRSRVEGTEWAVQCGNVWLSVTAGRLSLPGTGNSKPVLQPIPYGAMPRLALAWVSTVAVRTKSREIQIGTSANQFLQMMGLDRQGNRYKTLRQQMHALAACHLQLGYQGRTFNGQPVQQFDAWLSSEAEQRPLWPGVLVLTEGYYSDLIKSAVPLDQRALVALKGSALALDIYSWLAHRLHRIKGGSTTLRWHHLRDQFGQGYSTTKDFRRTFLSTLKKVLAVYPEARVKAITGGLNLVASPPPIPYRGGPTE